MQSDVEQAPRAVSWGLIFEFFAVMVLVAAPAGIYVLIGRLKQLLGW